LSRRPPKKATLQKNIKRVKPQTWRALNEMLVLQAQQLGVEDGKQVRTDCTVVESKIHHPNDSSLLWDSVRVLDRLMARTREDWGIAFHDHRRARLRGAAAGPVEATTPPRYRLAIAAISAAIQDYSLMR
jgi:IS5 family transposase